METACKFTEKSSNSQNNHAFGFPTPPKTVLKIQNQPVPAALFQCQARVVVTDRMDFYQITMRSLSGRNIGWPSVMENASKKGAMFRSVAFTR